MAIEFEIQGSNSLEFDFSDPQNLEFGTRDIVEINRSGDYPDLTNKPQINGVMLVGNKTTEDLLIDVGVTSWNGQTGDVIYTPPEAPVQSVNGQTGDVVLNASDVGALPANTPIPSKTSDLQNDSGYITGITSSDVTSALGFTPYNASNPNGYVNAAQAKNAAPVQSVNGNTGAVNISVPTKTSDLTNDSGFITGMTILSYGSSTWADFLAAYQANKVVYCRASSNANPASGSQTRLAFMAYVNNETNPTSVEFQYYRSVSSHSASQQGDQVFVYTLKSSGWSVVTREAVVKIVAGTNMTQSYSNGTLTLQAVQPTVPSASATAPSMDGTASAGSSSDYARADHIHPTDTSRQATLVSGTNIKTINNESLLGSGNIDIQGGGSVNKLTLYTDKSFTNLWVDQARSTTLLEQYDYDAQALKSSLINTDIIEVWNYTLDARATVLSWKMDTIDETYQMTFVLASSSPTFRTISFS